MASAASGDPQLPSPNSHPLGDASSAPHPTANALASWFSGNGGWLSPDVQIHYSHSAGFHLRALRPLSSPIIATCPLNLTLSHLALDHHHSAVTHVDSPLRHCLGSIPDHVLTYLLLIDQRRMGTQSPWHHYIACLPGPESMTTPLWFDQDDMNYLIGTNLAGATKDRTNMLYREWEHAVSVLRAAEISTLDNLDFNQYLWAATIVSSRAFISTHILPDKETFPILFPVVDILNHSVSAKVEWDFQPNQSFSLRFLETESIAAGDELFNNYAPKQNDELLLGYGFCLQDNPIEQFALKLAFPAVLEGYAKELDLRNPGNIPYGMDPAFLNTDPQKGQHFLRTKGHPFGRYENTVPFFRGIPPFVIYLFFMQSLLAMGVEDVREIDLKRPGVRITLQVLLYLHQAMEQKCYSISLSEQQEPQNEKQRNAKIYRDGQAKILNEIRSELKSILDRLQVSKGEVLPWEPLIVAIPDFLALLAAEFPSDSEAFQKGMQRHNLKDTDPIVWPLILTILASVQLITSHQDPSKSSPSLLFAWLHRLYSKYPLPNLEDGIEDAETYTFLDEHLDDFHPTKRSDISPTDVLDDLGLAISPVPPPTEPSTSKPALAIGPIENLGVRTLMWAMRVASDEVFPVQDEHGVRRCMYMAPWTDDRRHDEWIYDEEQ